MNAPTGLRVAAIDEHNWRAAAAVRVADDQLRFVAGYQPVALVILAKAYVRQGDLDWEPLAFLLEESAVGVAALAHDGPRSELLHLAVDHRHQGRGLGAVAVRRVLDHLASTRPECQEAWLTVHPDNERAQRLYRRAGFTPSGRMRDGEPIWSLNLHRS